MRSGDKGRQAATVPGANELAVCGSGSMKRDNEDIYLVTMDRYYRQLSLIATPKS